MKRFPYSFCAALLFLAAGCNTSNAEDPVIMVEPQLDISDATIMEMNEGSPVLQFTVNLTGEYDQPVRVNFSTADESAFAGLDYVAVSGSLNFNPPESSKTIEVEVITDEQKEGREKFSLSLSGEENAQVNKRTANGIINNDDTIIPTEADGYSTPASYPGWQLAWGDEFDESTINTDDWVFEIGTGSNGWGNNELEYYTDRPENAFIEDGKLVIRAREENYNGAQYTSARMITKGKREIKFGRIDIRAKLPEGQGIWPALWMLGANIDQVSWPACGEIDIMELVGHEPAKSHGTVHFGPPWPNNQYKGQEYRLSSGKFSDAFHVFSIHWKFNAIYFYVDDILFFEVTPALLSGQAYPFNNDFFFLFNVAVGGDWPGRPDATTQFPQTMTVDYIRVFQPQA